MSEIIIILQTQDIAIRCIQKNVRKFMGVRGWPWWRLLIKITPMLNVHRTENQLKSQTVSFKTKMLNDFLTIFASFSRRSSTFFALNSRKWIKKGKSYEHRTKSSNLGYVPNIFNCYMNVN